MIVPWEKSVEGLLTDINSRVRQTGTLEGAGEYLPFLYKILYCFTINWAHINTVIKNQKTLKIDHFNFKCHLITKFTKKKIYSFEHLMCAGQSVN